MVIILNLKKTKMKHIYIGLIFCICFLLNFSKATAQYGEILSWENDTIDNKVEVAFRTMNERDLLGGVSVIDMEEMTEKAYTTNSLGFVENLIGGVNGNIWGMDEYLVVIDGMVRDANNVLPTEIKQITVLKGPAAVVLYGSRAAKGVVQITTKRGTVGKSTISIRANTGILTPKAFPKYLGSAEYMTLYNEARMNDGSDISHSPEKIYNYASGENPYRYPNLNMYSSDYVRKASN